ncbi:MAG: hypothetical protein QOH28_2351 [Actinomycetota bacterium]|nr:hypothetical protein [Actinomycetota bacterium]
MSIVVLGASGGAYSAGGAMTSSSVPGTGTASASGGATSFATASADLAPFASQTGKVYMSEDALGTNAPAGGPIKVHKNNASTTVVSAFLLAAGVPPYALVDGDVKLNGNSIAFDPSLNATGNFPCCGAVNSRGADVTSIVKPVVDGAASGDVAFTVAEPTNTTNIDGEILAVILNDPTLPTDNTVSFQFGTLNTAGDTFSIGLANPAKAGDQFTMSLGDSFSYQGGGQSSQIDVNGSRLTSSAGGNDDSSCKVAGDFGNCGNGALITVGGIGDSTANPPDPNATDINCGPPGPPRCDDELYNLRPFVNNGDTSISVNTVNPSNNDNIFFVGFQVTGVAVVGEGITLSPASATNPVGGSHTVTAKVQDANGNPIANRVVTFDVTSGPNAGKTGTATTNASGAATFTYSDTGGAGTDTLVATFTDSTETTRTSNTATKTWVTPTPLTTSIVDKPDPVTAGSNVQYTVTVRNTDSESSVSGVQVTDTLPAGTTFVSRSASCTGTGPVTCSLGTINAGASKSVNVVVRTSPGSGGTNITDSATTTPGGSTGSSTTHVNAPTGTSVSGHVDPGGSITTGGNNPSTLLLPPSGPGADVIITLKTGLTFCAGLPCRNPQTQINNFPGYNNPSQPITLRLTLSHPTLAAAQNDLNTSKVYKLYDDPNDPRFGTVILVPNCTQTGIASPSPCVNRRFIIQRPPNWQTTFEILYLSGDGTVGRR